MKLYQTNYKDDASEGAKLTKWSGTLADARADRVSLKKYGMREIETEEVDVPTAKPALLAFLNHRKVQ